MSESARLVVTPHVGNDLTVVPASKQVASKVLFCAVEVNDEGVHYGKVLEVHSEASEGRKGRVCAEVHTSDLVKICTSPWNID